MSFLGSLLLAWAAVHAFAALSYGFLYVRRGSGSEFTSFAGLSAALAVYCMGGSMLAEAPNEAAAVLAQRWQFVGVALSLSTYCTFIFDLAARPKAHLVMLTRAWAALGVGANLAGLFFDPANARFLSAASVAHPVVPLSAVGVAWTIGGIMLSTVAFVRLFRTETGAMELRPVLWVSLICTAAYVYDTAARIAPFATLFMLEHATVIGSVIVSFVLLRRFVRDGDELARRTLELRRSYIELRHVQEELVRKEQLAAVGELSAVIAHEVRNPLAILKNAAAGLRRRDLPADDKRTLLSILDEETDRLNRLVNDLLTYARPVEPQVRSLDLDVLVTRAVDLAQRATTRSSLIHIDLDLEGAPKHICGDRDLLERALINIVDNAMQAMPGEGEISVRARATDIEGRAAVAVDFRDTGEGMDTLVRSRARDPFFTTRPSGTGLGLAIVERVVSAHGGHIELESGDQSGTTVSVVLPQNPKSEPPEAAAS